MKRKGIALLCAITLLFSGCASSTNKTTTTSTVKGVADTAKSVSTPTEKIEQETEAKATETKATEASKNTTDSVVDITYTSESKTYKADDNKHDILTMSYSNPTITIRDNADASKNINDYFATEKKSFDDGVTSSIADAKSLYAQGPDTFNPYASYQSYDARRCDNQVISFQSILSNFMGGAHGDYVYIGYNFDTKTGKKLTLDDIATNKTALLSNAKKYINAQLNLPIYSKSLMQPVDQSQDIINTDILKDDNWYFTKFGLTFVSNPYILGSYAAGAFFFTVPYQQLDGLKPDYQYNGNFAISGAVGTYLSADLNGDGKQDTVNFNSNYDANTDKATFNLKINGKAFTSVLQSNKTMLTSGVSTYPYSQYYLIDLDTSDHYIELALQYDGGDNNYQTYFFRYDGKNLNYLGSINDELSNFSTNVPGDGTLTANLYSSPLQIIPVKASYKLNGSKITPVPQEWYTFDYSKIDATNQSHKLLKNVTVYTNPDTKSDKVTLTSADGPVTFPATDNDHWIKLKTANGKLYFLYMKDFSTLDSGQNATTVFENLFQAG